MGALTRLIGADREQPAWVPAGTATMRTHAVDVRRGGRVVLESVDYQVVSGQIAALVGPNGAGKSTLLGVLTGDLTPSSGSVELHDRALTDWTATQMARRRAVLPQTHTVGFAFTARQVVTMGRAPWRNTAAAGNDEERVEQALATCDVDTFADRPFPSLSGGERARVALARVLAQSTQTLLLDEPTAALDIGHQETVLALARRQADAGAAVVVVLHDLGLAAAYADRVAVLDKGRIAADGPPREVLRADLLSRVYQHPVEVFDHPQTGAQLVLPRRG